MKFNEFAKTFPHEIFGELTVIKSNKEEDIYWFVGKEIQQILGFAKLEQAIRYADLDDDEVLILEKKNNTKLFKSFIKHYDNKGDLLNKQPSTTPILSKYSNSITLVKESGLYGLAMTSRKPIAKYFRRAIRKDILPGVRKLFEKVKEIELKTDVILHLDNEYQKLNSKMINAINMQNGGVIKTVSYNIKSCKDHYNNKTPKQVKKMGRDLGLSSKECSSAKEVFRTIDKSIACAMSLTDNLVCIGIPYEKAVKFSTNEGKLFFNGMIENLNVNPKELTKDEEK